MKVRTLLALACVVACTGAANDTKSACTDGSCDAQHRRIPGVRVQAWRAARLLQNWREMHGFADVETWSDQAWRSAPAECIQDPLLDHPPAGCINGYLYDGLREEALRNASAVCSKLAERSIKNIFILGDSFMRQFHAGSLGFLLSNARNGALAQVYGPEHPFGYDKWCEFEGQYETTDCRDQIVPERLVCDGAVKVRYLFSFWFKWPALAAGLEEADLVLWSDGNHGLNGKSYWPFCDPTLGADGWIALLETFCHTWSDSMREKIVWVGRHQRTNPRSHKVCWIDGPAQQLVSDGRVQRALVERCGVDRIVDMHEITTKAIYQVPDIHAFTYDGVHWGSVVNWVKAAWLWSKIL